MGHYTRISLLLPVDLTREQINERILSLARKYDMEVKQWDNSSTRYSLFPQGYEIPLDLAWRNAMFFFGTAINITQENRELALEGSYYENIKECSEVDFEFLTRNIEYARPKPGMERSYREYLENFFKDVHLALSAIKTIAAYDSTWGYIGSFDKSAMEEYHNDYIFYSVIWFGIANTRYYRGKENFLQKLSEAYQTWRKGLRFLPSQPQMIEDLGEDNVFIVAYPIMSGQTPPFPGYSNQEEEDDDEDDYDGPGFSDVFN